MARRHRRATARAASSASDVGRRQIGHLHGDRVAHFGFPKADGRAAARRRPASARTPSCRTTRAGARARSTTDADVEDVIALLRLNYDRVADARVAA